MKKILISFALLLVVLVSGCTLESPKVKKNDVINKAPAPAPVISTTTKATTTTVASTTNIQSVPYNTQDHRFDVYGKPVIYLYPQTKQEVMVRLDYKGEIIADYPKYSEEINGWRVMAYPDGRLINLSDNKEYSYLFWEGIPDALISFNLSKGFVVKGIDTISFLQNTLSQLGLTPREYNEFIVYWYPKMKDNKYNLIHFATTEYTDNAKLTITPRPDSILRVFMVYKSLDEPVSVAAQIFPKFTRQGFSVIEWGGTEVK